MAYYATARIFADPFGAFLEGQRAAYEDVRKQQELLRRMYETYLSERRVDLGYARLGLDYEKLEFEKQQSKDYAEQVRKLLGTQNDTEDGAVPAPPQPAPTPQTPQPPAPPQPSAPSGELELKPTGRSQKLQDRIVPDAPSTTTPPLVPQSALPPVQGGGAAARPPGPTIGGVPLFERARPSTEFVVEDLKDFVADDRFGRQQASPPPPPTGINMLGVAQPAQRSAKPIQERLLPEPVAPPAPGQAITAPGGPATGRKRITDRIPVERPRLTPAEQQTVLRTVQEALALRREIEQQLRDPTLTPEARRNLMSALQTVDRTLEEGRKYVGR